MAGGGGPIGGSVWKPQERGFYKRRIPLIQPIPSGTSTSTSSVPVIPPAHVYRPEDRPRGAVVLRTALPVNKITPKVFKPLVVRHDAHIDAIVKIGRVPPAPNYHPPVVARPLVVRGDFSRPGVVVFTRPPLKAPPVGVPGRVIQPLIVIPDRSASQGQVWIGKRLVPAPTATSVKIFRPKIVSDHSRRRLQREWQTVRGIFTTIPLSATGQAGPTLLLKTGPYPHLPNLHFREPGFTSDTFQLLIGNGLNNTFIGGMSPVPAHSNSPGLPGEYSGDATYFYFCYATNSWGRIAWGTSF